MSTVIETKLRLTGEDRASAEIAKVVKNIKAIEEAGKVSAQVEKLAKSLLQVEKAERAVSAAVKAQAGLKGAHDEMKVAAANAARLAGELDRARVAQAAFNGVKAAKGSEQARAAREAAIAVREAGAAYRQAEAEVRKVTSAVSAQSATLHSAERAAVAMGVDIKNLAAHERTLKASIDSTTASLLGQVRAEENAAKAAAHHLRERREYDQHVRRHGAIGQAAAAASGYVGAHSVTHVVKDSIKAGARYQHEVVALRNAGRTPAEMKEIEAASRSTTNAVPTSTFEENLKVINETTGAFGDLHHAIENLTFMQKGASVLKATAGDKIHDNAGELGNKLARFFEMRGSAGNTPVFQREASEMMRAMVFSRGNFNPESMLAFGQQAKGALPLYDERFLTKIAPSIATEFGGDRAGTAANAFRSVVMGKVNDKKQAEAWMELGLLDPGQAIMKAGHAVGWKAGAIKNTNQALSDPLKFMEETVLPALQKNGVNIEDKLELSKSLGTMFRNSNSNLFAETLSQKQSRVRLHKDEANINLTRPTDEIFERNLKQDPTVGMTAVKAGLENLLSTASSPLMETAASGLNSLARGLQSVALAAKDHPNLAVAGGVTAAAGGLGAAGLLSYKLMNGFGLGTSATALTASAKALDGAALHLAGGKVPTAPDKPGAKGGGIGGAIGKVAGALVLPQIAEAAQDYGALTVPDPADGFGKGVLKFLDPRLADLAYGKPDATRAVPSMTRPPGAMPLTIGGGGLSAFGLSGPSEAIRAQEGVADSTRKVGEESSTTTTILNMLKGVITTLGQSAEGATIQLQSLRSGIGGGGDGSGGGGGGSLIHKASLGGVEARGAIGGAAPAGRGGSGGGGGVRGNENAEVVAYIRSSAARNGIDPDTAVRVSRTEGLGGFEPGKNNSTGDKGTSFGPFQLHYKNNIRGLSNGGLGDVFTRETGLHARDSTTWKQQVDFALKNARKSGWGAWHGAKNNGIGNMQGIGGRPVARDAPDERAEIMQKTSPGGRQDINSAAERMNQAATRFEAISVNSHHSVEVSAKPGSSARTIGMRSSASGPIKADTGVSMPQAQARDGDWV